VLYYDFSYCMTKAKALLSVRLDSELAESLDEYCAKTGQTRTDVVKEGVAQYLISRSGPTLHSLAEGVLPPIPEKPTEKVARPSRQQRFRDYTRAKRRR
jgi:predicted DNA-binding protein